MSILILPPVPYHPPLYEDPTECGLDVISGLPGYDPSYTLVHYDECSDYEENAWFAILRKGDQLYEVRGGYCVMAEGPQKDRFEPVPVSEEYALAEIAEWERISGFRG